MQGSHSGVTLCYVFGKDRSLFMAGAGAEEKIIMEQKKLTCLGLSKEKLFEPEM